MIIDIDTELVVEARRLGGHATNEEAATLALEQYVERLRATRPQGNQLDILELVCQVDYDDDYDYKAERLRATSRVARVLAALDEHRALE